MSNHLQPRLALGAVAVATLLSLGACADAGDDDGLHDKAATGSVDQQEGENGMSHRAPGAGVADGVDADMSTQNSALRAGGAKTTKAEAPTVAVISTGNVALEAADVADARFDVQGIVDELRGTVSQEEATTDDDGKLRTTRMVLRIPSDRFNTAMQELEKVGQLKTSSSGSEDVTTKVIDNEVRIRAQERALERMEALLAQAGNLREVIAIESQLTRRQAELDSLKSTQKWLDNQTTLATITLSLERTPEAEKKEKEEEAGFLSGLERGWSGLVAVSVGLVTLLGMLLPFAVVLALLGVPLWIALRSVRRRRPFSPSEPDPA